MNFPTQKNNDLIDININKTDDFIINNELDFSQTYPNFSNYKTKPISLDTLSLDALEDTNLNGTNLNDLGNPNIKEKNKENNVSLIKSLTKEIINNLKENNLEINDNKTIKYFDNYSDDFDENNDIEYNTKKFKKNNLFTKDKIEEFISKQNPLPETNSYIKNFFEEYINLKDFIILFVIYFILSQDMIKDFFSKYFTSLNPDNEGKVNVQGVILYGLILCVIYTFAIKLL